MKRGFLVMAIITVALVVGLATVRFSPWLRTQFVSQSPTCDTSSEPIPNSEGPANATATNCQRSFFPLPSPVVLRYACNDGVNNDGDQWADAADPGCHKNHDRLADYLPFHTSESGEGQCADGKDNDADSHIDRRDPGCYNLDDAVSLVEAMQESDRYEPDAVEAREPECADKKDNDGDGDIDANDTECDDPATGQYDFRRREPGAPCSDGEDNDADGLIDKGDPGCHEEYDPKKPYRPEFTDEAKGGQCADNKDNDFDTLTDREDPGCYALAGLPGKETIKYVRSTFIDAGPPGNGGHYRATAAAENSEPECIDGKDNDLDGYRDNKDPDCYANRDATDANGFLYSNNESNPECKDGLDNDRDNLFDKDDPGCYRDRFYRAQDQSQYRPTENELGGIACRDGADNEYNGPPIGVKSGDGRVDRDDAGCHIGGRLSWPYNPFDRNEGGDAQCDDGKDNNGNGQIDGEDPRCHYGKNINWPYIPWYRETR